MDLASLGKLLGSESRVKILASLMGGQALPATELAFRAGVTNQTASEHLATLEKAMLIKRRRCGRHSYFEIYSTEIARAIETFVVAFPALDIQTNAKVPEHLRVGRFCYDHLAGQLGVALTHSLIRLEAIAPQEKDYLVINPDHSVFQDFGIDVRSLKKLKRHFARQCIDWSERCPHLAGSLGAALSTKLLDLGWISRSRDDRSVTLSEEGRKGLLDIFEITIEA